MRSTEDRKPMHSRAPVYLTALIGRDDELASLREELCRNRLVTLTGSGGCGKTRLAAELARTVEPEFDDTQGNVTQGNVTQGNVTQGNVTQRDSRFDDIIWVELAPVDGGGVAAAVASALGTPEVLGESLEDTVARELASRGAVLVVLDNAEHVVEATAAIVALVCSRAPAVTVLCTSREPIGVTGELVWRVPSLSTPRVGATESLTATVAMKSDAVQLFSQRASLARRSFVLTDENASAVAQICDRLDGVPLAVELAAACIRTMPAERIAIRLDDRFRLLAGSGQRQLPRQQTLFESIRWSEGLLSSTEQAALRRLGVFVGAFTDAAAEAVVGAFADIDPYDVPELVRRLVDKSLVQFDSENDHYSMLETIRSFAVQRLVEAGETEIARDAHALWFARWLASVVASADAVDDANTWWEVRLTLPATIDPHWPDCAAALEWVAAGTEVSLRLVRGLGDYWALRQRSYDSARFGMPALRAGDRFSPVWLDALAAMQAVRTNALDAEYAALRSETVAEAERSGDRRTVVRLDVSRVVTELIVHGPMDSFVREAETLRDDAYAL